MGKFLEIRIFYLLIQIFSQFSQNRRFCCKTLVFLFTTLFSVRATSTALLLPLYPTFLVSFLTSSTSLNLLRIFSKLRIFFKSFFSSFSHDFAISRFQYQKVFPGLSCSGSMDFQKGLSYVSPNNISIHQFIQHGIMIWQNGNGNNGVWQ